MTRPETEADRWAPDELLVPALLAGSPTVMDDLSPCDRAWVVASLKLEGLTAEQMTDRLACSVRLVRALLADPGAVMARLYLVEREAFADTLRMLQSEVTRLDRERTQATSAADRYKLQLDRLLDRLQLDGAVPTFPKCGHPRTRYNTYKAPKTGKENCRQCHADAQADYRARKAARSVTAQGHNGVHDSTQRSRARHPARHVEVITEDCAVARVG